MHAVVMAEKAQFPDEQSESGEFARQEDAFRSWVTRDPSSPFPAVPGRYHLYISLACPWACRALILRNLKGLEVAVGVTVVDPLRDDRGWAFREGPGHTGDPIQGWKYLREAYLKTDPHYVGRVTVPVLWDKESEQVVNNSEDDICRMFNGVFAPMGTSDYDFFPAHREPEHAELSAFIYENINNGVYRAGFATRQSAYEEAVHRLFGALDEMERRLADRRYLLGEETVEADWRLFCTLVRFDPVYVGHFKCNIRRIVDYPNLHRYLKDLFHGPGIAETVDFDHIKRHYYMTHQEINPTRIVPVGPVMDL
jgi:putative glutathione S-transferase